jgi:nitrate reductase beta subunit
MFWNNVETKPGIGYPKEWENQERYRPHASNGRLLRQGAFHIHL